MGKTFHPKGKTEKKRNEQCSKVQMTQTNIQTNTNVAQTKQVRKKCGCSTKKNLASPMNGTKNLLKE